MDLPTQGFLDSADIKQSKICADSIIIDTIHRSVSLTDYNSLIVLF